MCASRWSFTKNHYMMHSQQNVNIWNYDILWLTVQN